MSDNLLPGHDAWLEHNPRADYTEADADDFYDEDLEMEDDDG